MYKVVNIEKALIALKYYGVDRVKLKSVDPLIFVSDCDTFEVMITDEEEIYLHNNSLDETDG